MTRADLPVTRRVVRGSRSGSHSSCRVAAMTSCGDDVPSKADFSTEIGKVTGGRVSPELAGCVYDRLAKDQPALLRRAIATPDLSKAEDDKMARLLAQCVLDRDSTSKRTTTTTGR